MKIAQPEGLRGSLKRIQQAVNARWLELHAPILKVTGAGTIDWLSPLQSDGYAEYRDASFLDRIGHGRLAPNLAAFWPARGPQWDALGVTDRGDVLLVEAKAHIAEMCSPGTSAGPASRARIEAALDFVADSLGAARKRAPWADCFYQLANRLAHLHFLRSRDVPAWLLLINFTGDDDMAGPQYPETWDAAYAVAFHAMGLKGEHPLSRYVLHLAVPVGAVSTDLALGGGVG